MLTGSTGNTATVTAVRPGKWPLPQDESLTARRRRVVDPCGEECRPTRSLFVTWDHQRRSGFTHGALAPSRHSAHEETRKKKKPGLAGLVPRDQGSVDDAVQSPS
jgi:hypothetical protein